MKMFCSDFALLFSSRALLSHGLAAALGCALAATASGVTFSTNTLIDVTNTIYEGQLVIVGKIAR